MNSRSLRVVALASWLAAFVPAQALWQSAPHTPPFAVAMAWDGGIAAPVMIGGSPTPQGGHVHVYGPEGRIGALPYGVYDASMAYDAGRDVVQVLGLGGVLGPTLYEGRGSQWTTAQAPWTGSSPAVMVRDTTRAITVIGVRTAQHLELYDWDGATFVLRLQVPRLGTAFLQAIHHAGQGRVWLVENVSGVATVSAFDGATLQALPGTSPALHQLRCAYDPIGNRLLAHGGYTHNAGSIPPNVDNVVTWAYDGVAWTSLGTSAVQPGSGPTCTNPQTGRAVAHAQFVRQSAQWFQRPALHEWTGSSWSMVPGSETPSTPHYNDRVVAHLHPATGRTLVGINYNNTATARWYDWDDQKFTPVSAPPGGFGLFGMMLGSHETLGVRVGFGYEALQPRTYHQGSLGWSLRSTVGPPAGPLWGMAWDGAAVILFGTRWLLSGPVAETWAWDGVQWTQRTPVHSPTPRSWPQMVFDAGRRRMVLFGGVASAPQQVLTDTWEWDGVDWSLRAQGPMSLADRVPLYWHAKRARCVLHVPVSIGPEQFWEWDGATWQSQTVLGTLVPGQSSHLLPTARGDLLRIGIGIDRYDSAFPASYASIGAGCRGTAGTATIDTALHDQPWQGDGITVRVRTLPPAAAAVFLLTGFSTTEWARMQLPLSLAAIGAGPCELRVAIDVPILLGVVNGEAAWGTLIPVEPVLLGLALHQQALVPDPAANPFGWVLSNAATLRIGHR
jgi:hypothetical protein